MHKDTTWQERFREKFIAFEEPDILDGFATNEVIEFISDLLEAQRKELIKEVEKIKKDEKEAVKIDSSWLLPTVTAEYIGYNKALDDVLALLRKKE